MKGLAVAMAALAGCSDTDCCKAIRDAGAADLTEVAADRATANRDVDILYVIDDSASLDAQTVLKNTFPAFASTLAGYMAGMPSVHIGVVTTDLGTKGSEDASAGAPIGTMGTAGACAGTGKAGALQTNDSTLVIGTFITDTRTSDGSRSTNYTSSLPAAFSTIASVGAMGCGFEQPLEAIRQALTNNPANTGFLRPEATLAVVILEDEDDCSFAHSTLLDPDTTTLGPLQSFRCTRFGVTCDGGGTTPDEMNEVGPKSLCHSNESSSYLTHVADHASFLIGLKGASNVYVAAIAGSPTPIEVELRAPLGSTAASPALRHTCSATGDSGSLEVADPGVRLAQFVESIPRHTFDGDSCGPDFTESQTEIARQIRLMNGDRCLVRDIASPAECVAIELHGDAAIAVPPCESSSTPRPCFKLVPDTSNCVTSPQLRFDVERDSAPTADAIVSLRCKT